MAEDEYELLPHKEIRELRAELKHLREKPTERTFELAMAELSAKIDRIIDIFDLASKEIKVEEGGLSFHEKMKPIVDRLDKLLEQNGQIAEGIVALSDMMDEINSKPPPMQAAPKKAPPPTWSPPSSPPPFPPPPPR